MITRKLFSFLNQKTLTCLLTELDMNWIYCPREVISGIHSLNKVINCKISSTEYGYAMVWHNPLRWGNPWYVIIHSFSFSSANKIWPFSVQKNKIKYDHTSLYIHTHMHRYNVHVMEWELQAKCRGTTGGEQCRESYHWRSPKLPPQSLRS